jgi:hypothetical protein
MFERLTLPAREVLVEAQSEAITLGHRAIGTEHLLIGLLHDESSVAGIVLTDLDVDADWVRSRLVDEPQRPAGTFSGEMPFTPPAIAALLESGRQADLLKASFISTEHFLLGLMVGTNSGAARVLAARGCDPEVVCVEVLRALTGQPGSVRAPLTQAFEADVPPSTRWYGLLYRMLWAARQQWPGATLSVQVTLSSGEQCCLRSARYVDVDHLELTVLDAGEPGVRRVVVVRTDAIDRVDVLPSGPAWIGSARDRHEPDSPRTTK